MNYKITCQKSSKNISDPAILYTLRADDCQLRAISTAGDPIFDDPYPFCFDDAAIRIGLVCDCFVEAEEFEGNLADEDFSDGAEEISILDIGSSSIRDYFAAALYTLGHKFTHEELEEPYYYDDATRDFLLRRA